MKFDINTTTEHLQSTGGLALAGEIAEKIGLCDYTKQDKKVLRHPEVLSSLFGLFVQGRSRYEEIKLFRGDELFKQALGLRYVPAPETVRLYTERVAQYKNYALEKIKKANRALLRKAAVTPITAEERHYIPIDVDVSPLDNSGSRKEGVSRTYKGHDGYAPIFSYIGTEGYMLDCDLREGKQHCQKGTPDFLSRNIKDLEKLTPKHPYLFRLDGGNDSTDTLQVLQKSGHFFLIKRNLRKESLLYWLDVAKSIGEKALYDTREGKTVYVGTYTGKGPAGDEELGDHMEIVFQVTERTIDKHGNFLSIPEVDVETYWTNLYEDPETIIKLYHDHGTSEQFHSELKTDMNIERLPSGKMAVNEVLLAVAMVAFNTLRLIGQTALTFTEALPYNHAGSRKRLRKVIDDLIRVGCKFIYHARKWCLKLWVKDPWHPVFTKTYEALSTL